VITLLISNVDCLYTIFPTTSWSFMMLTAVETVKGLPQQISLFLLWSWLPPQMALLKAVELYPFCLKVFLEWVSPHKHSVSHIVLARLTSLVSTTIFHAGGGLYEWASCVLNVLVSHLGFWSPTLREMPLIYLFLFASWNWFVSVCFRDANETFVALLFLVARLQRQHQHICTWCVIKYIYTKCWLALCR
jgi:hypothetical protein